MKQKYQAVLKAMGNPHELWMSLMPERYVELSDEARNDHVLLIPDFVYFSLVLRTYDFKLAGATQVEQRHWELAIMTFLLLRLSRSYQRIFKLHMCRALNDAEIAIRYALLATRPLTSAADLAAGIRTAQLEYSGDLLNHYLTQPKVRQLADSLKVFR